MYKTKIPEDMVIGTVYQNNNSEQMKIVEYLNAAHVLVNFVGYSHTVKSTAQNIRSGQVKNCVLTENSKGTVVKVPADMQKGCLHKTINYGELEIVEFVSTRKVKYKFVGFDDICTAESGQIRKGQVKNTKIKKVVTVAIPEDMKKGTVHQTISNGMFMVHRYIDNLNVIGKFVGYDHEVLTGSGNLRKGTVKNVMLPKVFGVGYFGIGIYVSEGEDRKVRQTWQGMLQRCYSKEFHENNPTYKDCTVCAEWQNFQVFAEWFYKESNYEEGMALDKDIIIQGNKTYSPSTCLFVTQEINSLLVDSTASRGEYALGVNFDRSAGKFKAQYSKEGVKKSLGYFETEEEAYNVYCTHKYKLIKDVALKQKEPLKTALLNWVIPKY